MPTVREFKFPCARILLKLIVNSVREHLFIARVNAFPVYDTHFLEAAGCAGGNEGAYGGPGFDLVHTVKIECGLGQKFPEGCT